MFLNTKWNEMHSFGPQCLQSRVSPCIDAILYFCHLRTRSDDQAIGHRHRTDAWPPTAPHHAHHGLRAAALPEAGQHGEDRPREDLHHSVLAGVPQAHDGGKLPGQLAGTRVTLTEFKTRCRCCGGLVSFDLKSYNFQFLPSFHPSESYSLPFLWAESISCVVEVQNRKVTFSSAAETKTGAYCTRTLKHSFSSMHCSQSASVFLSRFFLVSAVCVYPDPRPLHLIRKRTHRRKMSQMQKIKRSSIWTLLTHKSNDCECNTCKAN